MAVQKKTLLKAGVKINLPMHVAVGGQFWRPVSVISDSLTTENDVEDALEEGFKVADLMYPALYYVASQFGTQLLVKFDERRFSFVGLLTNQKGEKRMSKTNTYKVFEGQATNDFAVPDSDVVIKKGDFALKAEPVA